jgi:hypothetical protein
LRPDFGGASWHPGRSHKKWAKNFCCVTTRRRNFDRLGRLRQRSGALTARTLSLGVLDFDRFILPPPDLPLRRLPATNLAQAFCILAIALIPAPRPVLLSTPFAQANPRPRSAVTTIWLIMTLAHGSAFSQGTARGNVLPFPSGAFQNRQADS